MTSQPASPPAPNFGRYAERYAAFRPSYGADVYAVMEARLKGPCAHAADLGAGTGQVSADLLTRFDRVTAVEPDAAMAARIAPHERLDVVAARAEDADFPQGSLDAVVAGTAFHWMDESVLCPKARTWLRPGGVFFVFTYRDLRAADDPKLNAFIRAESAVWSAHRDKRLTDFVEYVDRIKATGAFAGAKRFDMVREWVMTPEALAGYFLTTSFASAHAESTGDEAGYAADFTARLRAASKRKKIRVRYPLDGAIAWTEG